MTLLLLSYFRDGLVIQRNSVAGLIFAFLQASFLTSTFPMLINCSFPRFMKTEICQDSCCIFNYLVIGTIFFFGGGGGVFCFI